jgi:hypothetical protein
MNARVGLRPITRFVRDRSLRSLNSERAVVLLQGHELRLQYRDRTAHAGGLRRSCQLLNCRNSAVEQACPESRPDGKTPLTCLAALLRHLSSHRPAEDDLLARGVLD